MKSSNLLIAFIVSLFFILSCQKELNFSDVSGPSTGTLKKDSVECLQSTVNGDYFTDSALTTGNFIDLQVDVASAGSYVIYSDTVNGFSFRDSGNFGNPGLNTVQLVGTGTPLLPGVHSFVIRYDTSVCIIDVQVQPSGSNAVYTFGGAGGTCTGAVLNGSYVQGVPLTASDTVVVNIQISSPGNYSISTPVVNGVSFSGGGIFNDITQNTVTLTGQGTALTSGPFNFLVSGSGSSCAFSVTFQ